MKRLWSFFRHKKSVLSKLVFANETDHDIKICLEPWAHEYRVKRGQKAVIIGEGELDHGRLEIHYSENFIEIWGWLESMSLLIDGKEQEMDFTKP